MEPITIIPRFLTTDVCNSILKDESNKRYKPNLRPGPGGRKSSVRRLINTGRFKNINTDMRRAAREKYGFSIWSDLDPLLCMKYEGPDEFTSWHVDGIVNQSEHYKSCKVTGIVLLSDEEMDFIGGAFELFPPYIHNAVKSKLEQFSQGDLLLIPAFVIHRVNIVTEGTRMVLTSFMTGPRFV